MTALLPFLDLATLDGSIQHDLPWNAAANKPAFSPRLPTFLNRSIPTPVTSEDGYALAHFAANGRVISDTKRTTIRQITDGTSNTFLMGMVDAGFKPWGDPTTSANRLRESKVGRKAFGSPFPNLIFVLMARRLGESNFKGC